MRTKLREIVQAGDLIPWEPTLPGDSCLRPLFITKEINDGFEASTWESPEFALRYAKLATDFDRFVSGDEIPVGWEPYDKSDHAFMARVDPVDYCIWTIRSVAPRPGIRVFGAFCEQDVFVALQIKVRSELGGRGDRAWGMARENAIAIWTKLFDPHPRFNGVNAHEFISEKAIVV